jgi:hypothetical protein
VGIAIDTVAATDDQVMIWPRSSSSPVSSAALQLFLLVRTQIQL